MIAYFSGTGNSLYVAKQLAHHLSDELKSIAVESMDSKNERTYLIGSSEKLGIVFPIYSWGAPEIVLKWLETAVCEWESKPYVYVVITCGEDIGDGMRAVEKILSKKKLAVDVAYTIVMPNNYMIMGDVYDEKTEKRLLASSELEIAELAKLLESSTRGVRHLRKGKLAFLRTAAVNPLFNRFARTTTSFRVSEDCTSCGICSEICPTKTISMVEGKPKWHGDCAQCLGCINYCPVKAIDFGDKTKKKGRYAHPKITVDEMKLTTK
ncbi:MULTISPECIES: EFR1 family ferrodoxin [unclassified Fusibacter]|uniref:EFR1 family ferrodoxin n=1 Tax=unclassified Fusibacter TaxID=2624464 RepID=UPI0010128B93|nr:MULTISPECIES: EFR1 family ferrodoxin [unclassified Fusibacter]MCK8061471.1 EFR1 family ferrodoxin [Fusibacter sp. A2]NPE23656.1 4Fe-4S binding protein [Fusibacter sp. A1]RXV58835.1 4Fe-4S ferredoxin [Fusibacter sp. A1]